MAAELNGVLVEAGPDGQPALFREPVEVVTAHDAASARAALDRLEVARRQGCWIAGFAAYELGYARRWLARATWASCRGAWLDLPGPIRRPTKALMFSFRCAWFVHTATFSQHRFLVHSL